MSKVIIFEHDGKLMVMTPAHEEVTGLSVEKTAEKDVPQGEPFWIIDEHDLPGGPQEAWEILETGDNNVASVVINPKKLREYNINKAESEKKDLLSLYRAKTENWNTDLMLGDISDDDRAKLVAWRNWRKDVETIDTSTASEETPVEFPAPPAI